jgi:hypothetical protein
MKCEQTLYLFLVASIPPYSQAESKPLPSTEFRAALNPKDLTQIGK